MYICFPHTLESTIIYLVIPPTGEPDALYVSSFPSYASGSIASAGIDIALLTSISNPDSFFTLFAFIVPAVAIKLPSYFSHVFPLSILYKFSISSLSS